MNATELKKWRKTAELTQPEAALALSVPLATYRQWEHGRHKKLPGLLKLATKAVTDDRKQAADAKVGVAAASAPKSAKPLERKKVVSLLKKGK